MRIEEREEIFGEDKEADVVCFVAAVLPLVLEGKVKEIGQVDGGIVQVDGRFGLNLAVWDDEVK
jgi:hypothetical protein